MRTLRTWLASRRLLSGATGLLTLFALASLPAQTNWVQLHPSMSPPAQYARGMAYDSMRDRIVLFGSNTGTAQRDTWEFDGSTWTQLAPALSPPARTGHAMVYDSGRRVSVLYGGKTPNNNNPLADTWEWNGSAWTQATPANSPPARDGHAMAYDPARRRVLLFGGYNGSNLNDTWEWDGSNWTPRAPSSTPALRRRAAMCYDSVRDRVVMFGGYNGSSRFHDTWEWDGVNWLQRSPAGQIPARRHDLAMVFDAARGRSVLFGGYQGSINMNDTWEWEGVDAPGWIPRSPGMVPPARSVHAMVYDTRRGRVVLFGGDDGTNVRGDTWVYAPDRPATTLSYGSGCLGSAGTPDLHPDPSAPLPWIGYPFTTRVSNLGGNPIMILGDSRVSIGMGIVGMPGCTLYANPIVFVPLGSAPWTLSLPNSINLTRAPLFFQALVPSSGTNLAGFVASNGLEVQCGRK